MYFIIPNPCEKTVSNNGSRL